MHGHARDRARGLEIRKQAAPHRLLGLAAHTAIEDGSDGLALRRRRRLGALANGIGRADAVRATLLGRRQHELRDLPECRVQLADQAAAAEDLVVRANLARKRRQSQALRPGARVHDASDAHVGRVLPEVDRLLALDQRDALRLRLAMVEAGVRHALLCRRELEVRREPRLAREAPLIEARDARRVFRTQARRVRPDIGGRRPGRRRSGCAGAARERDEGEERKRTDPPSPHAETLSQRERGRRECRRRTRQALTRSAGAARCRAAPPSPALRARARCR